MTWKNLLTELNAAKQKLAAALEEASNASKTKSYFLATMSHELRTPLNAVIGFSELLQTGKLPQDEHDDYLHSINLAGNSLLMLVNDVLDLSKLEAGQMVLTPQVTDLRKVLDEMRSVFQYKIKQKKLSLAVECPEGVPLLKLDSLRLRQIMLNLIGNAVKFTENGGIDIFVNFKRAPEGKVDILVGVRDTDMGIPEDEREKIFASFVQSRALRDTHAYNGTGLGLAISRRLAMQMGGCISLESEVGRGSCFRLELGGIEEAEPAAVEIMESAPEAAIFPEEIRMLIVDDVPMNLKVLQAMLRKLGIESVCAGSGAGAIEILKSDKNFKYVLTDLWMPEMDGVEFAKELKRMSGCENISVMAVTADTEMKQNFDMGAFSGMLLKPVTIDSIMGMVFGVPGAQ